jgi:hypothetical protein
MRSGGSIGPGGLGESKKGTPLKRVVGIVRRSGTMFSPDVALLECGHEAESWGGIRARCTTCPRRGSSER